LNKKHFVEIDFFRGIALFLMIIYHSLYILYFFNKISFDTSSIILNAFGSLIRTSFLLLVGISLALSKQKGANKLAKYYKKQMKRALLVFGCGMIITVFSYILFPQKYILFGILHLIGVGVLFGMFFAEKKWKVLLMGLLFVLISKYIHNISFDSLIGFIFGFKVMNAESLDYFPIFPWLGVIFIGIFLGNVLFNNYSRIYAPFLPDNWFITQIARAGRNSFFIYMIHVPIVILIFILLGVIRISDLI